MWTCVHTYTKHTHIYNIRFGICISYPYDIHMVSYVVATVSRLLKWQVSIAEFSLFYRALLQKRSIILRSLLIVISYPYDYRILRYPYQLMGWLRLVGSLKLRVSCAKEPYKGDDILQKRPMILRSLLIVATPYL